MAKSLAAASGVQERQISNFRKGKCDLMAGTLFALVQAMPAEARQYFFRVVVGEERSISDLIAAIPLENLVKGMTLAQRSDLLMAIASTMSPKSNDSKSSDSAVKEPVGNSV